MAEGGTPITSIRNLGPAVEAACTRAGIKDAETLRSMGADAAYEAMVRAGTKPHFIGYYVMHMGLQGRPWNDCQGKEKERLREMFDALCARARPSVAPLEGLDAILNEIGVIDAARR